MSHDDKRDEDVIGAGKSIGEMYADMVAKRDLSEKLSGPKKKKKHKNSDKGLIPYAPSYRVPSVPIYPLPFDQTHERAGNNVPDFMLRSPYEDSGFFFGVKRNLMPSGCVMKPADEEGHILIVGGPGSWKTTALIVPTLATWRGIIIAIDIKNDSLLFKQWTCFNRHRGKRVRVFSPTKEYTCGYDPYAFLRSDGEENLINNVRALALSLLPPISGAKDKFWRDAALNILTAAILYYFDLGATFTETMTGLQFSSVSELATEIEESGNLVAQMYIKRIKGAKQETAESAGMDLADLIPFATDPLIRNAFSIKDETIDWNDLRTASDPYDVILEIPEDKLEQWPQMTQLMINQLIKTLERRPERHSPEGENLPPVLVMLDEFPRLGKMEALLSGFSTLRSRGVTICVVIQNLSQLDRIYKEEGKREIVAYCPYKAILNATDPVDQEYLSKMVTEIIVPSRSISESRDPRTGEITGYTRSISESREPVVHPHEFATLKDVVLLTPEWFCRVDKERYFERDWRPLFVEHQ